MGERDPTTAPNTSVQTLDKAARIVYSVDMTPTENTQSKPVQVEITTPGGYTYTALSCPECGARVTLALDPRRYFCNHVKRCGWVQS